MFGSGKDEENAAQKRRKREAQEEDGTQGNVQLLFSAKSERLAPHSHPKMHSSFYPFPSSVLAPWLDDQCLYFVLRLTMPFSKRVAGVF